MTRAVLTFLCIAIAGCARSHRSRLADQARTELVGASKVDLLACAGVPSRSATVGNTEVLTYTTGGSGAAAAFGVVGPTSVVVGSHRLGCHATFVLRDNRVVRVTYSGRTGPPLFPREECGFIVENCLPR